MMSPLDLFVLRRIAELSAPGIEQATMPTILVACIGVHDVERRVHFLATSRKLRRRRLNGTVCYAPSPTGREALAAEPTHMRDKPGLTNR